MNSASAKKLGRSILYAIAAVVSARVFGPISALIGYAAGAAIYKALKKKYPEGRLPVVLGILAGIAVAFAVCVAAILALSRLQ